jgi:hypothetical protein
MVIFPIMNRGERAYISNGGHSVEKKLDLKALRKEASKTTFTMEQFRAAAMVKGFRPVLRAVGVHFVIEGQPQKGERVVLGTTRTKKDRSFRNPTSALALLQKMGVLKAEVEFERWHGTREKDLRERRPDMAERLSFAHSVARDDAWEMEMGQFRNARRYRSIQRSLRRSK